MIRAISKPELEVEGVEVPMCTIPIGRCIQNSSVRTEEGYVHSAEHPISPECQLHNPLCA